MNPPADPSWYVVHTKPRQESLALQQLLNQGFEAWLPMHSGWRKRAGQWERIPSPLFPRYLLLRPADHTQSIAPVRSTVGVSSLVRFGSTPARMPEHTVQALRRLESDLARHPDEAVTPFRPGMAVRIEDGPLRGLEGIVTRPARDRVMILLSLLGRPQHVTVDTNTLALP